MKLKKYALIIVLVLLILIDQLTKAYIVKSLYENSKELILGIKLTYVENTGGAFGVGRGGILGFIVSNFVILGIIVRFLYVQRDKIDFLTKLSLYFILAGGFSNLIDRIFRGFVVDFIDVTNYVNFPVFNTADICITIGGVMFIILTLIVSPVVKKMDKEILKLEDKSRVK